MKTSKRVAVAAVGMAAAAGTLFAAGPSVASTPQPVVVTATSDMTPPAALIGPNGEKPTEWGMTAVPVSPSGVTPLTTKEVGGGTWSYGNVPVATGSKCYSNYIHPTKRHSATAIKANGTDKTYADKDLWAKASVTNGAAYTCYTYWGVY
ncbi:lactococcin 972 family bacteriocin [Streptomyces sp. 8N706]|uniref:lactococcin 972 family bacteriocin n=1 Tax=Streptomyces sp. 8N706 TaxID=3457416 RepID=UPI003FD09607